MPAVWEELVSEWLIELSGRGVSVEPVGAAVAVTAYFADPRTAETVRAEVQRRWADLPGETAEEASLSLEAGTVCEEDWATSWKAYYHPLRIGRRLVIKPTWETWPLPDQPELATPEDLVIQIDPEMAFGTGTHETTQMCLEALETYLQSGDTVADIGAGSGILSIAAAMLGSGRVHGWEVDPVAVEVAERNFQRNGVGDRCTVYSGDALEQLEGRYQIVIANVHTPFLLRLIPQLPRHLAPGGRAILSGTSETSLPAVREALRSAGLLVSAEAARGEWVALVVEGA